MAYEKEPRISGYRPSTLRALAEKGRGDLADKIRARFDATGDDECRKLYSELCYFSWKALGKPDAPITDTEKEWAIETVSAANAVDKAALAEADKRAAALKKRGWFDSNDLPPDAA